MTIAILQCGDAPAELVPEHGPYGEMVRRLLGGRAAVILDVTRGDLPREVGEHEAYVLSGSPAGVYEPLPWIPPLLEFVRGAKGRARMVGICFGHQAMAQALGGQVVKSPKGWGIGLQRYGVEARAGWMDPVDHVDAPASHQDQVVVRPEGARVVAASGFTPFAALDYGDAISFQFHPEFTPEFGRALIEGRRERYGAAAEAAVASYDAPNDCAVVAGWIGRFLDGG
ncbi:type 1 glutamine amidotransferase [Roseomonas sp. CCTCC AB2023176]|uniref:glutamine amidotransferase-related protein n=1 Tax=Roseomonas sp. CCTCC AB2023176 TaxID=3342640 RepID=UPI0035DC2FF8